MLSRESGIMAITAGGRRGGGRPVVLVRRRCSSGALTALLTGRGLGAGWMHACATSGSQRSRQALPRGLEGGEKAADEAEDRGEYDPLEEDRGGSYSPPGD